MCGRCDRYIADEPRAICPNCKYTMSTEMTWVKPNVDNNASSSEGGGYVKGVVTYMIKDDLVVTPMSTISGIAMLNKCNITNISALEEKVVTFGMGEGLKLLKAALVSEEVLTSIFLDEKVAEKVAKPV
ncbi:hypothetical protein HYC85_017056 [Camellia sinensis]|uniref:DUF674 domain-containing protein n=1 Tax=Camellia sinensis TaxID=4442 RepID=A0A7J7H527_CAMSI|nr:hypothetical protein HYC85_017056 [Camellia sinensis]